MKSIKAQGISVNTIIIAALALIVLVVLIAIFGGRMGLWGEQLNTASEGQLCKSEKMQMFPGNSCPPKEGDTHTKQVFGNFGKCGEVKGSSGEIITATSDGCYKPGYVCCAIPG